MQIARSPEKERIILDALRASFTETRTGVHLSDLLKVRQALWGRKFPLPPTDTETLYFLAGRGHEEVFARLCGVQVGASEVKHVPVPGFVPGEQRVKIGISYRPDFRWDEEPTEFKTRRSNLAKPGDEAVEYDGYLEQLKGYCALDNVCRGRLIVFSLLEGKSFANPLQPSRPELAVYEVEFTAQDLAETMMLLTERRQMFAAALADESPLPDVSSLPLCAAWMCGKNVKTIVKKGRCVTCDKELFEPFLSRHPNTKSGAGHVIEPEQVTWEYQPRCKFYSFCRPQDTDPTRGAR